MRALLLIDDNSNFLTTLKVELQAAYQVHLATDESTALRKLDAHPIDLCVLDFYLGSDCGKTLFLKIRDRVPGLPCVLATARADKKLAMDALNLGINSMLEKPFTGEELRVHIEKLLPPENKFAGLELHEETFSVRLAGNRIVLTPLEFQILHMLWSRRNRLVLREEICSKLWGRMKVTEHTFDTHFSNMKKKIPELRNQIQVIRGQGYVLRT
jgi:two-component system OmpR family response regulator/two-component system response regulator QseB